MKLLLPTLFVLVALAKDCGNGLSCEGLCATELAGAGAKWACIPPFAGPKPSLCADKRFSCPTGYVCKRNACEPLDKSGLSIPVYQNEQARRASTKGLGMSRTSLCDVINEYLPSFCSCKPSAANYGGNVSCAVNVLDVDEIMLSANIEPCSLPMYMNISIQDEDLGFKWRKNIKAGDFEEIDIGLDIGIPGVTDGGVYLAVELDGDIDNVSLELGVDVCGTIPILGQQCGSDIPGMGGILPIWLIQNTFDFGDLCQG